MKFQSTGCCFLLLVVRTPLVQAFVPTTSWSLLPCISQNNRKKTCQKRWHASNNKGETSIQELVKQQPQPAEAVEALYRLRERQRVDLEMTENLLASLVEQTTTTTTRSEDMNGAARSFAASIAAGFDYGFVSRSEGAKFSELKGGLPGYGPPANLWTLGTGQFNRNLQAMKNEYEDEEDVVLSPKQQELHAKLEELTLDSDGIWERETKDGPITAPWIIKVPYLVICWLLDVVFEGKYVPSRFFLLETVARTPYFSYITMLHLYETLGFWRRSADVKRIHFAEEINEFRHLLIMESLGGDQRWWVRFVAQHSAIIYFVVLCVLWAISPSLSYKFSELLETHAVNTYGQFLDENEEKLKALPPSLAAVEYYSFGASDPFYAEFQTSTLACTDCGEIRRPGENMKSLYDVFSAIQADEGDHVATMKSCLDPNVALISPSIENKVFTGMALLSAIGALVSGVADPQDFAVSGGSGVAEGEGAASSLLQDVAAGASEMVSRMENAVSSLVSGSTSMGNAETAATVEELVEGTEVVTESTSLLGSAAQVTGFLVGGSVMAARGMVNATKYSLDGEGSPDASETETEDDSAGPSV